MRSVWSGVSSETSGKVSPIGGRFTDGATETTWLGVEFGRLEYLFLLSGIFLGLIVLNGWLKFRINTMKGWMGERMLRRLRYTLYDYILRFPLARFRRVKAAGFKGVGAWSHPVLHEFDVPVTRDLNLWTWVPWESRRLFSPGWAEAVEVAVRRQVDPLRQDDSFAKHRQATIS